VTVVPAKTVTTKKCAYVTLVMIGDEYIPGACVLAYSLKLVHVKADLVVMVTPDVSEKGRAILASIFDKVLEVPYIEAKSHQKRWGRFTDQGMYQWIDKSFTKFNCINLTQYDRIVMFDADMLALRNPDNLFDMAPPAGICTGVSMKAEEREPDETDWHGRQIASNVAFEVETPFFSKAKNSHLKTQSLTGCSGGSCPTAKSQRVSSQGKPTLRQLP